MKKVAIFDFNGTLIDDTNEWWICVTSIFKEAGILETEIPDIGKFIEAMDHCDGIYTAYHFFGVKLNAEQITAAYIRSYTNLIDAVNPYSSTHKTLKTLRNRGIICALVTFNWNSLLLPTLNRLNLYNYFRYIVAEVRDKTPVIRSICEAEYAEPEDCYYIGDMPSDVVCARLAGVKTIALLTDLVPERLMEAKNPDYKIRNLKELPKIIIG